MATNHVCLSIMEPSGAGSRRRVSASLIGTEPPPGVEEIKNGLAQIRRRSLDENSSLTRQFQSCVARSLGVNLVTATTAARAVAHIREVAGSTGTVVANRSAVVLNELSAELRLSGFRLLEPYHEGSDLIEPRIRDCWDLPGLVHHGILPDFAVSHEDICLPPAASPHGETKDCVALMGVNAASAEDGSLFFLQHFSNIDRALQGARHVVLVVALDKLVRNREEAEFQTHCMGLFGLESMLLNLKGGQHAGISWEALSDIAAEGQRTLHVILLDNGRSRLLESAFCEVLSCIGCRACLRQCPIGQSMGGNGAVWTPRDYLFSFLRGDGVSLDACLHCEACRIECPLSIDLPRLMWVAQTAKKKSRTLQERILGNPERLAKTGSLTAPVSNLVMNHVPGKLIKASLGLDARRELPRFHRQTFRSWFAGRKAVEPSGAGQRLIVYYVGCFANYYEAGVAKAVVRVLEKGGCHVIVTHERCCGLPMIANNNMRGFLHNAEHNISVLAAAVEGGAEIVTACPSCALMLKKEYPGLVGGKRASLVSEHTQYLDHYLLELSSNGKRFGPLIPEARSVFYHVPCHLKALEGSGAFLDLWRQTPGLFVHNVNSSCCGLGGYHGYKNAHSAVSREIGSRLFGDVMAADSHLVVSSCAACRMQIAENTGVTAWHPIQMLDQVNRSQAGGYLAGWTPSDTSVGDRTKEPGG